MSSKRPLVHIKPGKVVGLKSTLPNGQAWFRYKGIPYAEPPIGSLRFQPPVPLETFGGQVLDCSSEGNVSLSHSYMPNDAVASEDCLYLNVYTPVVPNATIKKLPVMVWIHGGAFCTGSGDSTLYDPEYLVQNDVVVVTFNYRLGPLGFLSLPSFGIFGNMGLKDQLLVLKWVHGNISAFGGDKNNVTLFGMSAGAVSVHLHCLSDESSRYFHKAICQSGVAISGRILQKDPEVKARRLAQHIGCRGNTDQEIYEFLHYMPAEVISSKQMGALIEHEQSLDGLYPFQPVIEVPESDQPFLTEKVLNLMMNSNRKSIPTIFGVNSEELSYKAASRLKNIDLYKSEPQRFLPDSLDVPEELQQSLARMVLKYYTDHEVPMAENVHQLTRLMSDNFYVIPTLMALEIQLNYHPSTPVYFYQFAMEDELNKYRRLWNVPDSIRGACHGDELCYLFSSSHFYTRAVKKGSRADQLRTKMCNLWTNFAKSGNPTSSGMDFTWEPYELLTDCNGNSSVNCLLLDEKVEMAKNPFHERLNFWRNLYNKYNGSFLKPKQE
ncbi:acetylcholinesterase-like isoform X4 [Armigeres subalbatus]|uniref:acetylcholinesterase-like isoform X4 n=1 Tax=Armigeres subalbatus TaxID=124917 RepID=UPI002ED10EE0